jgi:Mor family transcriptional regulator
MILPDIYQEIAAVTDEATAVKIARLFQGCQVYFPYLHGRSQKRIERDKAIMGDRARGMSWGELSKKYGLSERQVRRVVEDGAQRELPLPM